MKNVFIQYQKTVVTKKVEGEEQKTITTSEQAYIKAETHGEAEVKLKEFVGDASISITQISDANADVIA